MRLFTLGAAVTIIAMLGGIATSYAQNINCTGTVGGGAAVTTVNGNVTVPGGASCTLDFVDVTGKVTVQAGGSLLISAYDEPSTIGGTVEANGCISTLLEGNVTVNGDVRIANCTGTAANGFQGPGIVIGGNFHCLNNAGPCEAWLGQVAGNARIQNNRGAASDVSLNTIEGNLECGNNAAAPTHSRGYNWVSGNTQGQCGADFSTTTTSIGVPPSSGMACAALASLPASGFLVPMTVITSATDTPAGGGLPERCIVNGSFNVHTIPVSPINGCTLTDSFQVQLPLPSAWNGRFFLQGENNGSLPAATGADSGSGAGSFGITNGYAVADDDEGVLTSDMSACAYGNEYQYYVDPEAVISTSYQAQQVTALMAKYLIAVYYGQNASYSYDGGCSGPGREAMMWSQTFPQYFDAVFAGDPGMNLQTIELPELWAMEQWLNVYLTVSPPLSPPTPATVAAPSPQAPEQLLYPAFPVSEQNLFETALLQACDALDGVADGVIDNQALCNKIFNPATATYVSGGVTYPLQCPGAKNATCLSPAQIHALISTHSGARTTDGQPVFAPAGAVAPDHSDNRVFGYLYDAGWGTSVGLFNRDVGTAATAPGNWGAGLLQFVWASISPADPTYDPMTFNFTTDQGLLTQSTPFSTTSTSLDISKFINYGHKIIFYHSAGDPGINALNTISYYNGMAQLFGGLHAAQKFSRLYLIPNMGHCSGGPATDQFDMLTPLVNWVENGIPPGPITASGVNFTAAEYQGLSFITDAPDNAPTTRSRPLCPYPQEVRFIGSKTVMNGVPVATNPADLANAANYTCITPPRPYLQ
jgi:hypothetical protein